MNDTTKLPKWAQDLISSLELRLKEATEAASNNEYAPQWEGDEARVFLQYSIGTKQYEKAIGGNYTRVVFRTPSAQIAVSTAERSKELQITANATDIAIYPLASNVIRLTGRPW